MGDGKQTVGNTIGAAGALSLYFFSRARCLKQRELSLPTMLLFGITAVYVGINTLFSIDIGYSIFSFARIIEGFLVYYVFYCYSSQKTAHVFEITYIWLSLGGLLFSVLFTLFYGSSWTTPSMNLFYPTWGHNHIVDLLVLAFPLACVEWIRTKRPKYIVLAIIFYVGTVFSFSRLGVVIEFVTVLFVFFTQARTIARTTILSLLSIASVLFLSVALLIFIPTRFISRIPFAPTVTKQSSLENGRVEYWKQALLAIQQKPLFGFGPGTFILLSKHFQSSPDVNTWFAHNVLLQVTAETGFVGLLFCIAWAFLLRFSVYSTTTHEALHGMFLSIIAILIMGLFDYPLDYLVVWFVFCGILGMSGGMNNQQKETPSSFETPILTLGVLFVSIFFVYGMISAIFPDNRFLSLIHSDLTVSQFTNKKGSNNLTWLARALHSGNPNVISAIGDPCGAFNLEPKNAKFLRACLLKDFSDNKIKDVIYRLVSFDSMDVSTMPTEEQMDILTKIFSRKYFEYVSEHGSVLEMVSKSYYYLGLEVLSRDATLTQLLWSRSLSLSPGWGPFYVELASLERYHFHDKHRANEILLNCQLYEYPAKQCKEAMYTLQYPGFLKDQIHLIPHTSL
jgi:O-antigen ligase